MKEIETIDNIQPFIDVDESNKVLLGRNGEMTVGFRIRFPPIFTKEKYYFNELYKTFATILTSLPSYIRIHKQDFFTTYQIPLKKYGSYLENERAKMFTKEQFLKQESFIYLTSIPPQIHDASLIFNSAFKQSRKAIAGENAIRNFKEATFSFQKQIESALKKEKDENNFFLQQLSSDDILKTTSSNELGLLAKYLYLSEHHYSDILINKLSGELLIGDNYVDIISLNDLDCLPLAISPVKYYRPFSTDNTKLHFSMMAKVCAFLHFPHVVNCIIAKGDTEREKKKLETRGTILSNFAATSRENRQSAEAIDDFLENISGEGGEIVDCHFNIIIWAKDKQDLFNRRAETENALKALNFIPKLESSNKANLFFACQPGGVANIFKEFRFKTNGNIATGFLNLDDLQKSNSTNNAFQVADRFTGAPLNIDISDHALQNNHIENLNKFVLGSSGSGKSVTMNYYTMCNLRMGAHVVICDMGRSYEGLSDAFNGLWFEFSEDQQLAFNPFILYPGDISNGKLNLMKSTTLISIIKILWKGSWGTFTETESTTIENMIDSYYLSEPANYSFNTFYEYVTDPTKFHTDPDIDFRLKDFKYVLATYYRGGKYAQLLNASESLDLLHHQLIIFELNGLKESKLLPIVNCVIIDTIINKLNNLPEVRKQILQDECWKALANPQMEIFFQELVKTIRKSNGELVFISQEIEDIISSKIIKNAIINNCATKILLSQNQFLKRFDEIQSVLGLSDHEKDLVFSLNKNKTDDSKDILVLFSNGPANVYTIRLSLAEKLTCTSRQEEKDGIKKVAKYLNSTYMDAIQFIVENLADKISDTIKKAASKGEKLAYNSAVSKVLETL